ncbi:RNA polymerase sigma factor SigI [Paenibacillus swuensis]|uniref:RNA polymerase sigma factor SigI n=1 Tax=Paenibacillus swuensis TaxID=1178515 RepID=A0A172THM3_9BACL|nr:RNA polymerase sigma factor SigI [Paenibacillus swuensis]ANE46283.1 RNA polymerase sigma factor SigI [Paenibacillus swuensis]
MLLLLFKKFLGKHQSHKSGAEPLTETAEEQVLRIQQGDLRLRNQFITDYQPYVVKAASRFSKRYIDPSKDDEFSIALNAFNEAINQFVPGAGRSFIGFAETVIRRRLIDYVRKEQRFLQQVPYSAFDAEDEEDGQLHPIEVHQAIHEYEKERIREERCNEILQFTEKLSRFGITFQDLVNNSPKHTDSRQMFFRIGKILSEDETLFSILMTKKTLPIKELLEKVEVSRKTLERNRKYIIAISVIFNGNFPYLIDYLHIMDSAEGSKEHE